MPKLTHDAIERAPRAALARLAWLAEDLAELGTKPDGFDWGGFSCLVERAQDALRVLKRRPVEFEPPDAGQLPEDVRDYLRRMATLDADTDGDRWAGALADGEKLAEAEHGALALLERYAPAEALAARAEYARIGAGADGDD
jgi:hypothetical protein